MKVMVTGATGFIGRHVVSRLLSDGHEIIAVSRNRYKAENMPWYDKVRYIPGSVDSDLTALIAQPGSLDAIVHLAWGGLPNYQSYHHISENLHCSLTFIEQAVRAGVHHVLIAGTCLEYGLQHGELGEDLPTHPATAYGFAKDTLRKSLLYLNEETPFVFQWARLFYTYGEGQGENSLLSQLDRAIDIGSPAFNMSQGTQLRDFLPIEHAAAFFSAALAHPEVAGVINVCSGKPMSVRELVEQRCVDRSSNIELNFGHYPMPPYEPLEFWGAPSRLATLVTP